MHISLSLIWFFTGIAFLIFELMMPGFIVIFFAFGSFISSVSAWLFNVEPATQVLIFVVSSLVLLFSLRKFSIRIFRGDVQSRIDDNYVAAGIGKNAVVTRKITPELPGEIKFMGSFWRASSKMSIEAGETVVIQGKASEGGLTFMVEPHG